MIDFDELFEDINWGRAIALLVFGIIVIVAVVFVLLDYNKARTLRTQLNNDLVKVQQFQTTWKAPTEEQLSKLRAERDSWADKVAATGVELPTEFDAGELEGLVRSAGNTSRVTLRNLSPRPVEIDGYAKIQAFEVIFSARNLMAAQNFLNDLKGLNRPLVIESEALTPGAVMKVTVNFHGFAAGDWDEVHNCDVKTTMPEIPYREVNDVMFFKGGLEQLRAKVDQITSTLTNTKSKFVAACELRNDIDRLKEKHKIITERLKG